MDQKKYINPILDLYQDLKDIEEKIAVIEEQAKEVANSNGLEILLSLVTKKDLPPSEEKVSLNDEGDMISGEGGEDEDGFPSLGKFLGGLSNDPNVSFSFFPIPLGPKDDDDNKDVKRTQLEIPDTTALSILGMILSIYQVQRKEIIDSIESLLVKHSNAKKRAKAKIGKTKK